MGGYGGASGKIKDGCYYDSEGVNKIKDKNAIEVAEYYLSLGMYVVFYHENGIDYVPDLSVDGRLVVEVKGISSMNSTRIKENIAKANEQVDTKLSQYPEDERHEGKIVLVSRYASAEIGFRVAYEGYQKAKNEGLVSYQVEFWVHGDIHIFD